MASILRSILLPLVLLPTAATAGLRYTVHADVEAAHFQVTVCTDVARERLVLRGGRKAVRYLDRDGTRAATESNGAAEVRRARAFADTAVARFTPEGRVLRAGPLDAGECSAYRVRAADVAATGRRGTGMSVGDASWLLAPTVWLWRPPGEAVVVELDSRTRASLPWPRGADGGHRIAGGSALSPAWTAFGAVDERSLRITDSRLRVATVGVVDGARRDALHGWMAEVARSTATVHGRLPLPDAQVLLIEDRRRGRDPVPWGQTARGGGAAVHLYVRASASIEALRANWVATHELAHLFHPHLGDGGRWLAEGLASYYQNVLRARTGALAEAEAWRRLHAGFGRGRRDQQALPLAQVSRDMHRLGANMRTYWSGAAFWLQADVALRQRGSSLDAVLGRFRACCLPQRERWTPERFVAALDRQAAGKDVFAPLYRRMAAGTEFPSLETVYAQLGLRDRGRGLAMDDEGRALRHAIMRGAGP